MKKSYRGFLIILRNERGSLLVMSYLGLVAFLGIGAAFLMMAVSETRTAERQRLTAVAFHIAEAGLEAALSDLRKDQLTGGSPSWVDGTINGNTVNPNYSDFTNLYPSQSAEGVAGAAAFNGGYYQARIKSVDKDDVWVRSQGQFGGVTQGIQVYAKMVDVSPWNNAIFAGAGGSGGLINGNVDIRGSVHILGNGLTSGQMAVTIGGDTQLVGNNYSTLPASLKSRVPNLPTTVVNGETVETLNAVLRVKRGVVSISGSATVGEPNAAGNAHKEKVDGVYVTDGWSGNKGAGSVHSDNGTTNGYDLGDMVTFPSLNTSYEGYASYKAYLRANSLVLSNGELKNLNSSAVFSYSNAKGSISKDASGNLAISGKVYVEGAAASGNDSITVNQDITYTGAGVIYADGNITFNKNFVTPASATHNSFPNNVVGLMTPKNIYLYGAQNDIMGAFYAETSVVATKQYDIMGTIVANYFDFGGQVPAIFQVPELVNYLPDGMIGTSSKVMSVTGWKKF